MTELQYDPIGEVPPPGEERKSRYATWVLAVLSALMLALAGWWFSRSRRPASDPAPAPSAATAAAAAESPLGDTSPAAPPPSPWLPDLEKSDAFVRALVAELFGSPELDAWLASAEELLQQAVRAVLAISEGRSPQRYLTALPVQGRFAVSPHGAGWIIAQASYRRFDHVVDVFSALDTRQVVDLLQKLDPLLTRSLDENAFPGTDMQSTLKVAIEHLLATPLCGPEIEVVSQDDGTYRFADPRLEALSPPQKLLLRLGEHNGARVRAKLIEIEEALAPTPN